jgi:hypothetical protein
VLKSVLGCVVTLLSGVEDFGVSMEKYFCSQFTTDALRI